MVAILEKVICGNTLHQYLFFLLYIVIGIISIKALSWLFNVIFKPLEKKIKKYEIVFSILRKPQPILFIIFISIIRGALNVLYVNIKLISIIDKVIFVLYVSFASWFITKTLITIVEKHFNKFTEFSKNQKRYDHWQPLIITLIKVFVISLAFLLIIANFGYNINGLIAGLGIGGIVLALASRELLENFFSGLIIFTEKQFKVGDIIQFDDLMGVVKEINIRTSKIESFDNTLYIVPNSKLSQGVVENVSHRKARRVKETISLSHENSLEKLEEAKRIIRTILGENEKTRTRSHYIVFTKFNTYSIDLYFDYWVKDLDWKSFLHTKDDIYRQIKKQFEINDIRFLTINLK